MLQLPATRNQTKLTEKDAMESCKAQSLTGEHDHEKVQGELWSKYREKIISGEGQGVSQRTEAAFHSGWL